MPGYYLYTYYTQATIPTAATALEAAIVARLGTSTALSALAGGRFDPHDVPQGDNDEPSLPCVVYQVLADDHDYHLAGEAGIARAEVRFEGRSRLFTDAVAIAEAVRNLISGLGDTTVGTVKFTFVRLLDGSTESGYEPNDDGSDLGTHFKAFTYKFTYRVSIPSLS